MIVITWLFEERTAPPEGCQPSVTYGKTDAENLIGVLSKFAVEVVICRLQSKTPVRGKNRVLAYCNDERENVGSFNLIKSPSSFSMRRTASYLVYPRVCTVSKDPLAFKMVMIKKKHVIYHF